MIDWVSLFDYDGVSLVWKHGRGGVSVGSIAGTVNAGGYIQLKVNGRFYYAHRIIWEMHNGQIPDDMEIDHINHNKADNRIENLRLVRHETNTKNAPKYKNNTSGVTGVSWYKRDKKWLAQIMVDGNYIRLGLFDNFEAAVAVRKEAELRYGFHKNHGA